MLLMRVFLLLRHIVVTYSTLSRFESYAMYVPTLYIHDPSEFLYPNYDHACLSEVDATNLLNTPFHLISFTFALSLSLSLSLSIYIYPALSEISPHWSYTPFTLLKKPPQFSDCRRGVIKC